MASWPPPKNLINNRLVTAQQYVRFAINLTHMMDLITDNEADIARITVAP